MSVVDSTNVHYHLPDRGLRPMSDQGSILEHPQVTVPLDDDDGSVPGQRCYSHPARRLTTRRESRAYLHMDGCCMFMPWISLMDR